MPVSSTFPLKILTDEFPVEYLPLADDVIILGGDGSITKQGSWDDMRIEAANIGEVMLDLEHEHQETSEYGSADSDEDKITTSNASVPDKQFEDLTRRTGDITLYSKKMHLTC